MFLDISCNLHGIDNGRKLACEKMEKGLKAVLQTERLILRPWEDDEKLWELFPISLTEPSEKWAQQYQRIEAVLTDALENACGLRMNRIGSTAIAGIMAKDRMFWSR